MLQKISLLSLDFFVTLAKRPLCSEKCDWKKQSTRVIHFHACCPFLLFPPFFTCPFAVETATRVAENNDIIAGPLAAYGN